MADMGTMLDAGYHYFGFHRHFPLLGGQAPEAKAVVPENAIHNVAHDNTFRTVCGLSKQRSATRCRVPGV